MQHVTYHMSHMICDLTWAIPMFKSTTMDMDENRSQYRRNFVRSHNVEKQAIFITDKIRFWIASCSVLFQDFFNQSLRTVFESMEVWLVCTWLRTLRSVLGSINLSIQRNHLDRFFESIRFKRVSDTSWVGFMNTFLQTYNLCGTGSPDLNSFQYCISPSKTHPWRIPLYVPAGEVTSEKPPSSAMHSLI